MTAAIVAAAIFAYPAVAALFVSWRCRRIDADFRRGMNAVLRSRTPGGSTNPQAASHPSRRLGLTAGVERQPLASPAAPPAPQALVGAADPRHAAPTRPPRVRVTIHA